MTEFEILNDVAGLLDSLKPEEQRQVMAALAERYGLRVSEKNTGSRSNYRPAPRRGKAKSVVDNYSQNMTLPFIP